MRDLMAYRSVRNWLLGFPKHTQENYIGFLGRFCRFAKMNPDQLLGRAEENRRDVHGILKLFYEELRAWGLASMTRSNYYMAVRSFLARNDVLLGRTPRLFTPKVEYESRRLLTPGEVAQMINYARTARDKAIISFLAQSGQRVGVLSALRYGHLREQLENSLNPIIVEVKGELFDSKGWNVNKGGIPYHFAVGKECAEFLMAMIAQRVQGGEVMDDFSWLFRNRGHNPTRKPAIRPLANQTIHNVVAKAARDAGIQTTSRIGIRNDGIPKTKLQVHPHTFRRWWKNRMRHGGVADSELLDYMLGHKVRGVHYAGTYDQFDAEYVRREYIKAEPFLTVLSPNIASLSTIQDSIQPEPSRPAKFLRVPRQRVITEAELESYLVDGWRCVTALPSGKIVIEE